MCLKTIINTAIKSAKKSNYYYRVGAVIFKSNRIYASGRNHCSKPTRHLHPKLRHRYHTVHAEIDAIAKLNQDCSHLNLLVIKLSNSKETKLTMAKPCIYCQRALKFIKFKKIYFSNRLGQIEEL